MSATLTETVIPVYTLQETSREGNAQFEIVKSKGLTPHQKELFFTPHRNDFYLFVFVMQGGSRHWLDMISYTTQPNALYFASPQSVILKEEAHCFEGITLSFTDEFLSLEENRLLKKLPIILNRQNGHELLLAPADVDFVSDILHKMLEEAGQKNNWRNGMLLAYLRVLLIHLSRLYTVQFGDEDASDGCLLLKRFNTLIAGHFAQTHDVASYAEMLNLSPGHFSELIKEQSGKTPIEHIHERLALEAKRMLFHTEHSIKEIAYRLGFEDASYFTRFFKRITSDTPLAYRNATREMYQ